MMRMLGLGLVLLSATPTWAQSAPAREPASREVLKSLPEASATDEQVRALEQEVRTLRQKLDRVQSEAARGPRPLPKDAPDDHPLWP